MALVSMRQLLDHAAENGYGIPAFNVNNLEQVQTVMSAADEVDGLAMQRQPVGDHGQAERSHPGIEHVRCRRAQTRHQARRRAVNQAAPGAKKRHGAKRRGQHQTRNHPLHD